MDVVIFRFSFAMSMGSLGGGVEWKSDIRFRRLILRFELPKKSIPHSIRSFFNFHPADRRVGEGSLAIEKTMPKSNSAYKITTKSISRSIRSLLYFRLVVRVD